MASEKREKLEEYNIHIKPGYWEIYIYIKRTALYRDSYPTHLRVRLFTLHCIYRQGLQYIRIDLPDSALFVTLRRSSIQEPCSDTGPHYEQISYPCMLTGRKTFLQLLHLTHPVMLDSFITWVIKHREQPLATQ